MAAWLAAVAAGFAALNRHALTVGSVGTPAADPASSLAPYRLPGKALAAILVHPECPCTSASLAEFGDFLARAGTAVEGLIVTRTLPGRNSDSSLRATRELGGRSVPVVADHDGRIAAALGAETSGHVILLDADGELRFSGGITIARGHRGRAPGQDAMLAALQTTRAGHAAGTPAPVFGCALGGHAADPRSAP